VFQGGVHHRDSRGNDSVVYAGGAQWMNVGMGVMHSERPPKDIQDHGGVQEIIQLWVNTPAKHKMDQPAYYPLHAEEVSRKLFDDGRVTLNVFAGEFNNVKGSIPTLSEVNAATVIAKQGGSLAVSIPTSHHTLLYLLDGKITLEGYGLVEGLHAVMFKNDGEQIAFKAQEDTRMLLLSGQPLDEEVVSYGPFVMNTQTEIMEAMRDYQKGKMGILIED
jgi:redox-sensitive bicupin YhaK (pirin superfamily)